MDEWMYGQARDYLVNLRKIQEKSAQHHKTKTLRFYRNIFLNLSYRSRAWKLVHFHGYFVRSSNKFMEYMTQECVRLSTEFFFSIYKCYLATWSAHEIM